MEDDFMVFYDEWFNDFIWTKNFEKMTTEDYKKFEQLQKEKIKGWDIGSPEIPY